MINWFKNLAKINYNNYFTTTNLPDCLMVEFFSIR